MLSSMTEGSFGKSVTSLDPDGVDHQIKDTRNE